MSGRAGTTIARVRSTAPAATLDSPSSDPRDIAAVAIAALTEPGHEGKADEVTGPQALTNAEQVAILAETIGQPLRFVDLPADAARQAMLGGGMPAEIVDGLLEFGTDRSAGGEQVSDAVQTLTGRPAGPSPHRPPTT